jgi:hypothetical protein
MRFLIVFTLFAVMFAGCADTESSLSTMSLGDIKAPTSAGDLLPSSILREGAGRMFFSDNGIGSMPMDDETITITPLAPTYERRFTYPGPASDFQGPAPIALFLSTQEFVETGANQIDLTITIEQGGAILAEFVGTDEIDGIATADKVGNGTVEVVVTATGLAWVGDIIYANAILGVPKIAKYVTEYEDGSICNTFIIIFCFAHQTYNASLPDAPLNFPESNSLIGLSIEGGKPSVRIIHICLDGTTASAAYATCYNKPVAWLGDQNITFATESSETAVVFGSQVDASLVALEATVNMAPVTASAPIIYIGNISNSRLDLDADEVEGYNVATETLLVSSYEFNCVCVPSNRAAWNITASEGTIDLESLDGITLIMHGGRVAGAEPSGNADDAVLYGTGPGTVEVYSSGTFMARVGSDDNRMGIQGFTPTELFMAKLHELI